MRLTGPGWLLNRQVAWLLVKVWQFVVSNVQAQEFTQYAGRHDEQQEKEHEA